MKQPIALLRWHICRKDSLSNRQSEKPEEIQVTVTEGSDSCLEFWRSYMDNTGIIVRDIFSWWDESEDENQAWIRADLFIEALSKRNLLFRNDEYTSKKTPRILAEDMVFLQFLFYRKQFETIWSNAFTGRAGLERIIMVPSSRWMDFTQQAREASSTMYRILLSTGTTVGGK